MKKEITAFLLVSILLLTSCNSELLPQVLASNTQNTVADVKADSVDIFDEIQRNVDLITKLKGKVQQSEIDGSPISLNDVIKDVEIVAKSYEKLSNQRADIRKALLRKVKRVENMQNTVDAEITLLQQRKTYYIETLRLLSDPNPEIARTNQKALSQAIAYVDAQKQLWIEFSNIQQGIIIEMTDIQQTIDSFLSMIESTSILFSEGLNLLRLQRDISEAVKLFASDIPTMIRLTSDMERSWDTLDYLVNSLTGIAKLGVTQ